MACVGWGRLCDGMRRRGMALDGVRRLETVLVMECVGGTAFEWSTSAEDGFVMECVGGGRPWMECVGWGRLLNGVHRLGMAWFDGGVGVGRLVSLSWKRRII